MSHTSLRVVIIGGGLGGLCLAQGLKGAGIDVGVYERDRSPQDRLQGYRIHLEPAGNRALAACLPAELWHRYHTTSDRAGSGYRMSTEQLRELLFVPAPTPGATDDPAAQDRSVSRIALRELLLTGMEGVVHFGKTFTHYQEGADGTVKAFFDDGTCAEGDVLVAADGGASRVRRQLLPQARVEDTGVLAVMGKLALTSEIRGLLVPDRLDTATSVLGPGGCALFLALHERVAGAEHSVAGSHPAPEQGSAPLFDDQDDYLFWAFLARRERYKLKGEPQQLEGAALQRLVLAMTDGWHPRLRQLIQMTDPSSVICKPLRTATPLKPWQTRRITLLGDAIHSMPPTRGIGGNTALRDAELLCRSLVAARDGGRPLLQSIHDYESAMTRYGFQAVRSSMQALQLHVSDSRMLARVALPAINRLLALRRRSHGTDGNRRKHGSTTAPGTNMD